MNQAWQSQLPLSHIKNIVPVSGGDVNDAFRIETDQEDYFLLVQRKRKSTFLMPKLQGSIYLKKSVLLHRESLIVEKLKMTLIYY